MCEFLNNVCPCTIKICINDNIKNINKKIEISKYNDSPNSLIKDIYRNENDITILIDINEKCQCKTSFKEFLKMSKLNLYQENKEKDIKTLNEFKESGTPIQMEQKKNIQKSSFSEEETTLIQEDFYDVIINIKSVKEIEKGWDERINERGEKAFNEFKNQELIKIGVIGNSNKGKSFLLSKISKISLPSGTSIRTEGLSIKFPELEGFENRKIVLLDSAGLETPVLKDENYLQTEENIKEKINNEKEKEDNEIGIKEKELFREKSREKLLTELFLQNYIINNTDILILIVGILTYSEQKLLNRIKTEIKKSKIKKPLFVIHNLKTFYSKKQVEDYIEDYLKKSATFELKEGHKISSNKKLVNGTYYYELNSNPKIFHLIFANDFSNAGNFYNSFTLDFLENTYQNVTDLKPFNVIQTVKERFIEISKDIIEKNENLLKLEDFITDEEIIKAKQIKLKTSQNIVLKKCLIDELGFSNLKGNGFEPTYNYYKKDGYIKIRVETPGNTSIQCKLEFSGEYTIIRITGNKNLDIEPKIINENIYNTREFGLFDLNIFLKTEDYNLKNKKPEVVYKKGLTIISYELEELTEKYEYPNQEEDI